jgi:hypothetical protein
METSTPILAPSRTPPQPTPADPPVQPSPYANVPAVRIMDELHAQYDNALVSLRRHAEYAEMAADEPIPHHSLVLHEEAQTHWTNYHRCLTAVRELCAELNRRVTNGHGEAGPGQ